MTTLYQKFLNKDVMLFNKIGHCFRGEIVEVTEDSLLLQDVKSGLILFRLGSIDRIVPRRGQ